MNPKDIFDRLRTNFVALDNSRKIALFLAVGITLATAIFLSAYFTKPVTSPLYSNLTREDLNSMSRILSENGMEFVIMPDNGSIEVATAKTGHARMLLAEHGLPSSQESGYELFDRVNTLGLTSFMQGVTNKRAIEGELVRTIQMINGVNSARVHLVMEEKNVFRRNRKAPPSASVVLKTYGKIASRSVNAIRHMVAAAVPGLEASNVTIVGSDGTLMTTKDDLSGGSTKLVELEKEYGQDAEEKIAAALGAYLGNENLRVSVTVKLNSDKRRVDETVFDPDSRVERSVQVVRETGKTENTETARPVTIDQNLPEEEVAGGAGQSSLENSERREELTNYEINQKKISVVSDGYNIENLSIALLVNKDRLTEILGSDAQPEAIEAKVKELEDIVRAAVSVSEERGDTLTVNLVEFMPAALGSADGESSALMEFLALHFGAFLNTIGLLGAALLFALFGIRPLIAFLGREPAQTGEKSQLIDQQPIAPPGLPGTVHNPAASLPDDTGAGSAAPDASSEYQQEMENDAELASAMHQESRVRRQLEQMVTQSEERAAIALKHWLQDDQASVA